MTDSDDEMRGQKQQYLFANVMEEGFDTQEFTDYLSSLKEDGDDIDVWSLIELKSVVRTFQERKRSRQDSLDKEELPLEPPLWHRKNTDKSSGGSRKSSSSQPQSLYGSALTHSSTLPQGNSRQSLPPLWRNESEDIAEEEEKENGIQRSRSLSPGGERKSSEGILPDDVIDVPEEVQVLDLEHMPSTLETLPSPITTMTSIHAKISVKDSVRMKGGLFSGSKVFFVIQTDPFGWVVQRKWQEIQWLREAFLKFYPGFIVPPLPKKMPSSLAEDAIVMKRKRYTQHFFNELVKDKTLKSSLLIHDFLCLVDKKEFMEFKKQINKARPPNKITDMRHHGGKVDVGIERERFIYADNISNYIHQSEDKFQKLLNVQASIAEGMRQVSDQMHECGHIFGQMEELNNCMQGEDIATIYSVLQATMSKWGSFLVHEAGMIKENFQEMFKFYYQQLDSYKDLLKHKEVHKNIFGKAENKLKFKKERLYREKDIKFWDLEEQTNKIFTHEQLTNNKSLAFCKMLPKESEHVEQLLLNYSYYANRCKSEMLRVLQDNANEMKRHLIKLAKVNADQTTPCIQMWEELAGGLIGENPSSGDIKSYFDFLEPAKIMMCEVESQTMRKETMEKESQSEEKEQKEQNLQVDIQELNEYIVNMREKRNKKEEKKEETTTDKSGNNLPAPSATDNNKTEIVPQVIPLTKSPIAPLSAGDISIPITHPENKEDLVNKGKGDTDKADKEKADKEDKDKGDKDKDDIDKGDQENKEEEEDIIESLDT